MADWPFCASESRLACSNSVLHGRFPCWKAVGWGCASKTKFHSPRAISRYYQSAHLALSLHRFQLRANFRRDFRGFQIVIGQHPATDGSNLPARQHFFPAAKFMGIRHRFAADLFDAHANFQQVLESSWNEVVASGRDAWKAVALLLPLPDNA